MFCIVQPNMMLNMVNSANVVSISNISYSMKCNVTNSVITKYLPFVLKNILKPLLMEGTYYCWFLAFTAFHEKGAPFSGKKH